jgi:hypothetical protein
MAFQLVQTSELTVPQGASRISHEAYIEWVSSLPENAQVEGDIHTGYVAKTMKRVG